VNDVVNALRDDVIQPSLPQSSVLLNAPAQRDGMFRVGSVFEES
jgi:aspartyl-tRNA(Asn)/glutamyl-tRNA(Gln) amidotransferase subunit C